MQQGTTAIEIDEGTCTASTAENVCARCGRRYLMQTEAGPQMLLRLRCGCVSEDIDLRRFRGMIPVESILFAAWGDRGRALYTGSAFAFEPVVRRFDPLDWRG